MEADERARIDELAEELIQLVYRSGETIFIAAGLNGSEDVEAVLLVTTDPPRAKQLERLFDVVSRDWEVTREEGRGAGETVGAEGRRRGRDLRGPGPGAGVLGWN